MLKYRTILLISGMTLLMGIISCKKDKTAFEHSVMKPWFDSNCNTCHGKGKSNAADWQYDASDYNKSIKANIDNLYKVVYTNKTMPQGSTLNQTELDKFKNWYDAGYPAK